MGELSWESEILEDKENEIIRWRSVPGASVINSGFVSLKHVGNDAAEVTLEIRYTPPTGHDSFLEERVLEAIADVELKDDLRTLKHIMESEKS